MHDRFNHPIHEGDLVHIINGDQLDLGRIHDVNDNSYIIEVQIIRTPEMRHNKFPRQNQIAFISDEYRDMGVDCIAGLYGIEQSGSRPMLTFDPGARTSHVFDGGKWSDQGTTWQGAKIIGTDK